MTTRANAPDRRALIDLADAYLLKLATHLEADEAGASPGRLRALDEQIGLGAAGRELAALIGVGRCVTRSGHCLAAVGHAGASILAFRLAGDLDEAARLRDEAEQDERTLHLAEVCCRLGASELDGEDAEFLAGSILFGTGATLAEARACLWRLEGLPHPRDMAAFLGLVLRLLGQVRRDAAARTASDHADAAPAAAPADESSGPIGPDRTPPDGP